MSWNGNDLFNSTLMGGMPSGADSHQYLTTDGDGKPHWEPRLAYSETKEKVILQECTTPTYETPDTEIPNQSIPLSEMLIVGKQYDVTWNGIKYKTTAWPLGAGEMGFVCLGNKKMNGEEDTGEPFAFMAFTPEFAAANNKYWEITNLDENWEKDITIKIEMKEETIKPLDPKYLPEGVGGGGGVMYIEGTESLIVPAYADDALTTMLSYDQAKEIIKKPFAVSMNLEGQPGSMYPVMAIGDDSQKIVHMAIITSDAGAATGMTLTFSDTPES